VLHELSEKKGKTEEMGGKKVSKREGKLLSLRCPKCVV